jgi:hypothetical protein
VGGGVQVRQAGTVYTFQETEQCDRAIANAQVVRGQIERRLAKMDELIDKLWDARAKVAALQAAGKGRRPHKVENG